MASVSAVILLTCTCGCSLNQAETSSTLMRINEDGTMTEIKSLKTENLSDSEIVALETEINSALQKLDHIEDATVILSYYPGNTEICFQAYLHGESLDESIDEILGVMEEKLGPCDLEHSSIVDSEGNSYSLAQ